MASVWVVCEWCDLFYSFWNMVSCLGWVLVLVLWYCAWYRLQVLIRFIGKTSPELTR